MIFFRNLTIGVVVCGLVATTGCDTSHKDKREVHAAKLHGDSVTAVAFSPDNRTVASASLDDTVRLMNVSDFNDNFTSTTTVLALPRELSISPIVGTGTGFWAVAFSGDGTALATGNYRYVAGGMVQLWDLATGLEDGTLYSPGPEARAVAFAPTGDRLAAGFGSETLQFGEAKMWEPTSPTPAAVFGRTLGGVRSIQFSPDGQLLATASGNGGVGLWSASDGTLLTTLESSGHRAHTVAFSPSGQLLASAGDDSGPGLPGRGIVRIWDVKTRELVHTLRVSDAPIRSVAFSGDGTALAAGGDDHIIHIVDVARLVRLDTLKGHLDRINSIAFSPNGQLIASGGDDNYLRLWYVGDLVGQTCSDNMDNDNDGWIDAKDPDCADGRREIGYGSGECNDGRDNDNDGLVDGADSDCVDGFGDSEGVPSMDGGTDGDGGLDLDGGTDGDGGVSNDLNTDGGTPDSGV